MSTIHCISSIKNSRRTGKVLERNPVEFAVINSFEEASRMGYFDWWFTSTSGMVLNRKLVDIVYPLPECGIRYSADEFIGRAAQLVGNVYPIRDKCGEYRVHGTNGWYHRHNPVERYFVETLEQYLIVCWIA